MERKMIEYLMTFLVVLMMVWILASWVDVVMHNDPSGSDGDPAKWNAFMVLTEVAG